MNENDIVAVPPDPKGNEFDLVWTEFVPLGINLIMNDKSGRVKVVDFPRGSQARKVAIDKDLDPDSFKGATIVAVNGSRSEKKDRVDLLLALRDPSRPKTVKFALAKKQIEQESPSPKTPDASGPAEGGDIHVHTLQIVDDGPIGITFAKSIDDCALTILGFSEEGKGKDANFEGLVSIGDVLTHVNGTVVVGENGGSIENTYSCLETSGLLRPLSLGFVSPYLHFLSFESKDEHGDPVIGGPHEFLLEGKVYGGTSQIRLKGYKAVDGSVESRGIFLGDQLIFINGIPVGTGMKLKPDSDKLNLKQVQDMLSDDKSFPICLTFARSRSKSRKAEFDVESCDTKNMSVIATSKHQLGFQVGPGTNENHFIVRNFRPVRGSLQLKIEELLGSNAATGLSFHSINGEKIPSYANCDIVMNALKRAWAKSDHLELVLCNEAIKQNISKLK